MLKMYVDNEEVLSNNDISIKEEILSPSSTILNNLYPKAWEQDKDYVSRFYYPKDYSKFVLNNYTHILPESGSYATISKTGQIQNVDTTKEVELTKLDGDTNQYSTTGKNFLYPHHTGEDITQPKTINNVVFTPHYENGMLMYINANGTASASITYIIHNWQPIDIPTGTYYLIKTGVSSVRLNWGTNTFSVSATDTNEVSRTITSSDTNMWFQYLIDSGKQLNNVKLYPMLSNVSNATYEPYTGGIASPNPNYPQPIENVAGLQDIEALGKNLLKYPYYSTTFENNGIKFTDNGDGSITIDGTSTAQVIFYLENSGWGFHEKNIIEQGTYTINPLSSDSHIYFNCNVYKPNGTNQTYYTFHDKTTFTITETQSLEMPRIVIPSGYHIDNVRVYPQLEKGSQATSYVPYVKKDTLINLGKNLFDAQSNLLSSSNGINNTYYSDTSISLSGTASSTWSNTFDLVSGVVECGNTYTFQVLGTKNFSIGFRVNYTDNTYGDFNVGAGGTTSTITPTKQVKSFRVYVYGLTSGNSYNATLKFQLEKGTQATSYSPYFEPIELNKISTYKDLIFKGKGANLLDTDQLTNGTISQTDGYTITGNSSVKYSPQFIEVKEGSSYTMSCSVSGLAVRYFTYDSNKNYITTGLMPFPWTIPSGVSYIRIQLNQSFISNLMLNEGTTAELYEPYNAKGKWLLHKEIGKVVLNGSETGWVKSDSSSTDIFVGALNLTNYGISLYTKSNSGSLWLVNNFKNGVLGHVNVFTAYNPNTTYGYQNLAFGISSSLASDINGFKTWLGNNNAKVYYIMQTPTTTEITNEELIEQLNSIELVSGLNNISITSADLPGTIEIHYNYVTEQHITENIFSGMVKNTSDISLNPRMPKYCSLEILDYKTLLSEGDTLDFVIYNKTILEAINMVVNAISSYGFELGNVNILNGNDIIGTYSTDNKTAYDVLQYLADISGAKWNCRRKSDTEMYIDFYDPTLLPRGKQIDYTNEWACENNLVDLTFNYGTRDYRNKQVINSKEVYADIDYEESKVADSYTRDFILSNPIGSVKEITINGEQVSVATNAEKDIGVYADFYYTPGDNTISSNEANKPYTFGNVIDITYIPLIKGREVVQNDDEIERVGNQLEVNGIIARYEDRNDETDTNKLLAIGETYLKFKGEAEITLTLKTFNNDIYEVGQMVYFNAPIQELAKEYMVKSKEIQIIANDEQNVFYTYELSSSFNSERAVNWFDNQRSKTEGNIKDGEYISRNVDISSIANIIWDNVQATEITGIVGDNVLDPALNSPLNN